MMYKPILIYGFILISTVYLSGQIHLQANAGGGTLQMDGNGDRYFTGYRFHAGLSLEGNIPIAEDLTWESGIVPTFGQARFYRMARGGHSGHGDVPLDKSIKYTHTFWFMDVPVKVRYNAFGFMGVMAGVNLSWLLDRKVYYPDLDQSFEDFFDEKMIATGEAGLFFPITDRIRIDITTYKALDGRFYLSESVNESGKTVYGGAYSDYGFLVNVAYRLNR